PCGEFSWAFTAAPPSPEKQGRELPAINVRTPAESIRNTEFPALKYTLLPDTITLCGNPIGVLVAGAGVAGGAPPATVEIVYCCAKAAVPARSRIESLNMRMIFPL